jgi:hypothetical protein
MERPELCPKCLSKWVNIRGLLYGPGDVVGTQCDGSWHLGENYDPDRWVLSAADEKFLETQRISRR